MKIAVLITCFNRKDKTVQCLKTLKTRLANTEIEYDIHLTDDGCTDGTAEAVLKECPNAIIYKGGNLYWAGGMRLCYKGAFEKGGYDYFLFLNDDTYVNEYFVSDFFECHNFSKGKAVICGNTCDAATLERTYAGVEITSYFPYRTRSLIPTGKPERMHLCGANIMFIPKCIPEKIGLIPEIYVHSIADNDLTMRALRNGFEVIMTPHYCGYCTADHSAPTTSQLRSMTIKERWDWTWSPKGAAMKQWLYYQWTFFPWRIPGVIVNAIIRILVGKS